MIVIHQPERRGPPLTNGGGTLRRQNMWMTGNLQFDLRLPCPLQILRRTRVLLPLPVMIMQAGEPMCGTTAVGVPSVVIRESRMRLEDLTDSEVSTEWSWTGTMIECLGIHTCGTPPGYLQDPMFVIENGGFGIARDGQNQQEMIPIMWILHIDRAVLPLTLTDMVDTRTMTIGLPDGRTRNDNGIKVDPGQTGNDDSSSVILLLLVH